MGKIKIVIYDETNRKEFTTHIKRAEDALSEINAYVETKYSMHGGRRR